DVRVDVGPPRADLDERRQIALEEIVDGLDEQERSLELRVDRRVEPGVLGRQDRGVARRGPAELAAQREPAGKVVRADRAVTEIAVDANRRAALAEQRDRGRIEHVEAEFPRARAVAELLPGGGRADAE